MVSSVTSLQDYGLYIHHFQTTKLCASLVCFRPVLWLFLNKHLLCFFESISKLWGESFAISLHE